VTKTPEDPPRPTADSRTRSKLKSIRYATEFAFFLALKGIVRALPHSAARKVGALLGDVVHAVDRRHRWVADNNLKLALPEMTEQERRVCVRACFRHFGGVIMDHVSLGRFDAAGLCKLLTLEGWEHLQQAEERDGGVLILTGHVGNWEATCHPVAIYRGPVHIVARRTDNPWIEREASHMRERFGNFSIPKRGAIRDMFRVVRSGGRLGLLIDQRVHPNEGIEVPFFGKPAMTTPLLAKLSLRTGAPVVPIFARPEPGGRFHVVVRPAIYPEGSGEKAVYDLTARYLAVTEQEIRRKPECWLWLHERWLWLDEHQSWRQMRRAASGR